MAQEMKGRTIIELVDAKTGERETVAESNIIGPAVNWLLNLPTIYPAGASQLIRALNPMEKSLFGGIVMFENPVPETQIMFPANNPVVAYGAENYAEIRSTLMGAYNTSESEVRDGYVKHVWDYSTSQANGTIGAICLTDKLIARNAYFGCDYTKYSDATDSLTCLRDYDWLALEKCEYTVFAHLNGSGTLDHTEWYTSLANSPSTYSAAEPTIGVSANTVITATANPVPTILYYSNDLKEFVTLRLTAAFTFVLERWSTNINSLTLNRAGISNSAGAGNFTSYKHNGPQATLLESKTITIVGSGTTNIYYSYWYDAATQKLYLVGNGNNSDVAINGTFTLNAVNLSGSTLSTATVSNQVVTNKTPTAWAVHAYNANGAQYASHSRPRFWAVVNGYFYTGGNNCIYKVDLSNNASYKELTHPNVTGFSYNSTRAASFSVNVGGFLINGAYSRATNELIIDTSAETVRMNRRVSSFIQPSTDVSPSYSASGYPVPTKTYSNLFVLHPMYQYNSTSYGISRGVPMVHKGYLSTINNLDQPVVKTADKTMKVTYILEQV